MGFGAPLPFDLPTAVSQVTNGDGGEPGGFVDDVELANASYGQAETFVTPLQMALVAATVANDGELMRPRLVTALTGKRAARRTIGPESMGRVHLGRRRPGDQRGDGPGGRGAARAPVHDRRQGPGRDDGRQVRARPSSAARGEPHSWFIGFAPAENPQVAIAVLVEQAGRGGEVAAPIAGRPDGPIPERECR